MNKKFIYLLYFGSNIAWFCLCMFINHDWYKFCQKQNKEWYEYCCSSDKEWAQLISNMKENTKTT